MRRSFSVSTSTVLLLLWGTAAIASQTTEGSIRGDIRDVLGDALPGATITATGSEGLAPIVTLSDADGAYRLVNLSPGHYTVSAQLAGFTTSAREAIPVRAGLSLTLHFELAIGRVEQSIVVQGDVPMLETSSAGHSVHVSGALQQSLPLAARQHWSEVLRLAPGAVFVDTTANQASLFFVHGAGAVSGSTIVDGADISSAVNGWTGYVAFPDDTVADAQIRTSGLDASAPLGMGAALNVSMKSGTNRYQGSGTWAYTPKTWVSDNTPGAATSQTMTVNQPEAALGGPLQRNRWWFYASYRRRLGSLGLSRPADQIANMKALVSGFEPFDNEIDGHIAFAKITGQIRPTQQLSGFYNHDATSTEKDTAFNTGKFTRVVSGGHAISTRLASAWSSGLMSRLGFSWNDKGAIRSLVREPSSLPSRPAYRNVRTDRVSVGMGQLAILDNSPSETQSPYTKWTIAGDLAIYRSGWLGSHEIQVGAFLQPRMRRRDSIGYANGGFALEEIVLRDASNAAAGTTPFHRRFYEADHAVLAEGRFSDNAVFLQDTWRPSSRLTLNLGVRVDRIARTDDLFQIELQRSIEVGPRVGLTYLLTSDQRNAVRVSFMRLHDPPSINQLSASGAGTQGSGAQTVGYKDLYDMNLDGAFELELATPAATAVNPTRVMSDDYHQPYVEEWAAGYRRQLAGQITVDVGVMHREFRDRTALVEQNALYEGNRFLGFRNEDQNDIFLVTNNRWNWPVYNALEIVATKRTSRINVLGSYTRVWSHLAGTWQPNDPTSFIQPASFPFDRGLPGNDNRFATLNNAYGPPPAASPWSGPEWTDHVVNMSGVYLGRWGIVVAANYSFMKGWWSGPILRTSPIDAQFGSPTVTLANGRVVSNPLATTRRFAFPTRGEGQFSLPARHYLNVRAGRELRLQGSTRLQLHVDVFNLPNLASFQGFQPGAQQLDDPNTYGKGANVQPPRTVQVGVRFSF